MTSQSALPDLVVDVHCHMFNASDLPIRGFVKYVALHGDPAAGPLADLADWILSEGTVSYADDLARVNALLGPAQPNPQPMLTNPPQAGLVAPSDRIDAAAVLRLNALQANHPDLLSRAATAMSAIKAGPAPTVPAGPPTVAGILPHFDLDTLLRAVRWATLFSRSRLELAADYVQTFGGAVGLATPLMVDLGTNLGEQPPTTIPQQMELWEKISRASMLNVLDGVDGLRIHPFIAFDPLRQLNDLTTGAIKTAFDLVQSAVVDYGFVGVKVYPPMGWRPFGNQPRPGLTQNDATTLDKIVDDLATWCEEEDVPITAHCNDSNYASPLYAGMGQPSEWMSVLTQHPSLHLDLGHFGGAHANVLDYQWADTICANLRQYQYQFLYGDIGCDRLDDPAVRAAYIQWLAAAASREPLIESRLMFGTDWYMEALNPIAGQFLAEATNIVAAAFTGASAVTDFLAGNALHFLGFDDPSNKNNQRLKARYSEYGVNQPGWLA